MAWALQKCFQVTSEGETLIISKKSTNIRFDKKKASNDGNGFLLNTNL